MLAEKIHIALLVLKMLLKFVRKAKEKGININAEVAPHHFSLTDDMLKNSMIPIITMNPPLRTKEDIRCNS
jgi:dihydroorotase